MTRTGLHGRGAGAASFSVVVVVAAATRLLVIGTSAGGLHGVFNYDAGVYYAAADGLVHGKLPYRDFLLVHPPLSSLLLVPAALLGRVTSATTGFAAANLAVVVLGAVNAGLVVRLSRRLGCGLPAAVAGGLFYALWFGSVQAEFFLRLEPLGNFFFLLFLLGTPRPGTDPRLGRLVGWGALGVATCCIKFWWIAPVAIVVVWEVVARRRARWLGPIALGAAVTGLAVLGPFVVAAPTRFVAMIFGTQLGRVHTHTGAQRFVQLYSLGPVGDSPLRTASAKLTLLGFVVLGVAVLVVAWRRAAARPLVVVLVAQLVILAASPTFFSYYSDFLSVTLASVVAAACVRPVRTVAFTGTVATGVLMIIVVTTTGRFFTDGGTGLVVPFPNRDRTVAAARKFACIRSDSPIMLIQLDALDRSFDDSCGNWVDVTSVYIGAVSRRDRATSRRYFRPSAKRRLGRYLLRGDAVVLGRGTVAGIPLHVIARIDSGRVVARSGPYVLHGLR